jgi:hypothetical protein
MEANIVNLRTHASVSTSDQEQGMKAKIVNLETLFGQQVSYRIPQFLETLRMGTRIPMGTTLE